MSLELKRRKGSKCWYIRGTVRGKTWGSLGSISASSLRRRPCRLNAMMGAFSSGAQAM
jgi:hypothetical protein